MPRRFTCSKSHEQMCVQEALPTGPRNYWCFVKGLLCPEACPGLWGRDGNETQSFRGGVPRPAGRPVGASGLGREVLREGRSVPPPTHQGLEFGV